MGNAAKKTNEIQSPVLNNLPNPFMLSSFPIFLGFETSGMQTCL